MFAYYLDLALRSLKRNKVLTALMVLAIALGIGASMTTLTVLHVLSGDPMPNKSAKLYYPQLDPRDLDGMRPDEEPPKQVSWIDGMNLLHAARADRQVLMTGGAGAIQPSNASIEPFFEDARFTTRGFFPIFDVPFLYGHPWSPQDDDASARVVVLSRKLNEKLYGGADSTGKVMHIGGKDFRIVGVIDTWRPTPHFYDLMTGNYSDSEGLYMPLTTAVDLKFPTNGSRDCWSNSANTDMKTANCTWLQFWVELDTPAKAAAYKQYLVNYSQQQKSLGRFQREPNVHLRDLMQWLDYNKVVPSDVHLQMWLALGFLVVCLVNTIGLMLAKFLRRASELGVRRALGASRRTVFAQLLVEAGAVGLVGGIGGLLLALLGLWLVRLQPSSYAQLAHLDLEMLAGTFLLAVGATLLAGLLPAWRACLVTPALQLKSN
ncbi:ABC transporter permease [Oleiagrimonas soli]|uniref:ABC transporter ATP-binding protein n=1 Tax=Oleiagrimonas soli TaxID=1543381 RepID=A0A099CXX0_9GAMM|nr:ABC transporter permease [Oleiagrimonas soli]KGI78589.1 ABC transporter ATP-binding protein [Oleiagrimonas soli]MBB6184122.1 putative ABC transport system permease protein [Oleiagrimonas soli]